jgi:hypothetical protein
MDASMGDRRGRRREWLSARNITSRIATSGHDIATSHITS